LDCIFKDIRVVIVIYIFFLNFIISCNKVCVSEHNEEGGSLNQSVLNRAGAAEQTLSVVTTVVSSVTEQDM